MYLRFGWVVGNVGLIGTILIVVLSTSITFLTSLSIAAIATNTPVKTGGAYYMISRSLGIEIGGAVGIPLYLAQAFSVALYIIGFSESLVAIFPSLNIKFVGIITTILLGILSLFSTKAAIRAQFLILGVIILSLISLFMGNPIGEIQTNILTIKPEHTENFWKVFAVFFPAVTGIMAGVNMSGDLKNPSKSIPRGTFLAVGVGFVIYMIIPVILAFWVDEKTLIEDSLVMQKVAFWGGAILLGVWGATLSSAVGSLLGAPRVLQALTQDEVLPKQLAFLSRGSGPEQIPRWATIFTIIITLGLVYVGNLNVIAPILTMFFFFFYGVLNITAGLEKLLESPSFRPKFKVHWILSFLGTIGCFAVMFLINAIATIIAIFFIMLVYTWLRRRRLKTTWGDVRSGMLLQVARYALLRLDTKSNPKSWRPNILVLSGMPTKRWHLIDFAYGIVQEKGLITVATILPECTVSQEKVPDYEKQISSYLSEKNIRTLVRVTRSNNPFEGSIQLVNSYGLGSLVPNTILLGDTEESSHNAAYSEMITHFFKSKRNVIILQNNFLLDYKQCKKIDIWWGGLKGNGGLMMILGYLMKHTPHWQHVSIFIKMAVPSQEAAIGAHQNLRNILKEMRINFKTQVLVSNGRRFWDILEEESKKSDMVMLGLKTPDKDFNSYYNSLKENTKNITNKVFVLASQDIEFRDILS